jgi:hypothetical protein
MPLKVDKLIATEIVADGYEIKSPSKDPREYALGKGTYEDVFGKVINIPSAGNVEFNGILGNTPGSGEYILNNDYLNFPENSLYVLASVETYLKFQEAQAQWNQSVLTNKKLNISASIETYLKFWEANLFANIDYNYTNKTGFQSEFLKLINDNTYFTNPNNKGELLDRVNDKGIVEFGQIGEGSKLVYSEILKKMILTPRNIYTICNNPENPNVDNLDNNYIIYGLFDRFLDNGIVVREFKGNLIISSVEEYLRFGEVEANNFECPSA